MLSYKLLLQIMVAPVLSQNPFVDSDYVTVNSINCNDIFPFAFKPTGTSLTIVDWHLQNFQDNYADFSDKNSDLAVSKESYIAVCYRDTDGLFCGVTYQTERTFKWLRQITDAHPQGKAAIKTSASLIETEPSTSQLYQPTNDQRVYVSYEATDISIVVFASFNYLTGAVENVYRVHKGVTELANTMIMKHVMAAAALDGISNIDATKTVVSVVMSYTTSKKAFEIQFDNTGMKNPVPLRVFDYFSKYSVSSIRAEGFKNNDFSKVLGISAKRIIEYPNTGKTDVHQTFYNVPRYSLNVAIYSMHKISATAKFWVFSATAFLTEVVGSNLYTVWWYVSRTFNDIQEVAELSYTFTSTGGPLTSYVVSPDAPQICMTSDSGTGSIIYLDDVTRAAVKPLYRMTLDTSTQTHCETDANNNLYYCHRWKPDFDDSEVPIGLKQFQVNKPVVCLAINTQMESLSLTQDYLDMNVKYFTQCVAFTTILLEQKDTGTVHLVQLTFKRSPTFNDANFLGWSNYGNIKGYDDTEDDCMRYTGLLNSLSGENSFYKQYSFQINKNKVGYQLYSKALLNAGFDMSIRAPTLIQENTPTSQQLLSFYTAAVVDDHIVFDTNNLALRCKDLLSNSLLDLSITHPSPSSTDNYAEKMGTISPPAQPVYRWVTGATTFSALTQISTSTSLSPLLYQNVVNSEPFKSVQDPTIQIKYDYTVCQQPITFGLDPKVQKGLFCMQIDPSISSNKINQEGKNLVFGGVSVTSMDLNMYPYSNCIDRSTDRTKPNKELFSSYFHGVVVESKYVKQKVEEKQIRFQVDGQNLKTLGESYIQIQFLGLIPGTLGLQPKLLELSYKVGADARNVTWDQKLMFQLSCQPSDFVWQTRQDNRKFPLQITYFFGEGPLKIGLPQPIPTNGFTLYNIDQGSYLAYNFTVLYTTNVTSVTTITQLNSNVTVKDQALIIDETDGIEQWVMFGAIATSVDPYYYVRNFTNGKIEEDWIQLQLNSIVNISFVYNVAPYLAEPLEAITIVKNKMLVVQLPEIIDPDSSIAFIQNVYVFPSSKFVIVQNSKLKTGSFITFKPTETTKSGTYLCVIFLIDVNKVPRQSKFTFEITVLDTVTQLVPFIPKPVNNETDIYFKPDSTVGIILDQAFGNFTLRLKLNLPMQTYMNPLFTENRNYTTNITSVLTQYMQVQHKQMDVYSKVMKNMRDTSFKALSYNGFYLFIQLEFEDASLLSQSMTETQDFIYLTFNETEVFVSKNSFISTEKKWQIDFILPVQLSSTLETVKSAAQIVSGSTTGLLTANFIINLLMATSLQKMWGNLNVLQLVIATPLLQVNLPQNVVLLCQALQSVTQFQLFDSYLLSNYIFGQDRFSPSTLKPFNQRSQLGGYNQTNFIYNMGCLFYFAAAIFFMFLFALLLTAIQKVYKTKIVETLLKLLWFFLTPELNMRIFLEMSFELGICSYIQIASFGQVSTGMDIFSSILAVLGATLCFVVPIFSAVIVNQLKKLERLNEPQMLINFGALYSNHLVPNPTLHHLLYNVFFMLRRLATIICIFKMHMVPSFQIGVMMWMNTFWLGYSISVKPFEDPALNSLETFNEMCYYFILLLSFTFTEFVQGVDTKSKPGYLFIALILTMLLVNIVVQLKDMFKLIALRLRRMYMLLKLRQKKWDKPRFDSSNPQAYSRRQEWQTILLQQYRQRVWADIIGVIKSYFINKFKPKANPIEKPKNESNLIRVKTKTSFFAKLIIPDEEQPALKLRRPQPEIISEPSLSEIAEESEPSMQSEMSEEIVNRHQLNRIYPKNQPEILLDSNQLIQPRQPTQQELITEQMIRQENQVQWQNWEDFGHTPQLRYKIKDREFKPFPGMTLWDYVLLQQSDEEATRLIQLDQYYQ